jgi:TolB-like protein/DNA-binding winged helix-turn-helix (wHTH) protein/Flp pilus assembly protein TadD
MADSRQPFRFGQFLLEPDERRLTRDGHPVALTPRAFDTLLVLVEQAGRLVTREELLNAVWKDTAVEEQTLTQNVFTLRKALGTMPDGQPYVVTVAKGGYRFEAPVERVEVHTPPGNPRAATTRRPTHQMALYLVVAAMMALLLVSAFFLRSQRSVDVSPRVTLVVLPFTNLTGNADEEYLTDGLTEEVISRLARADRARLGVIARTSAMVYKTRPRNVADIGRDVGADYLLEGSVRRAGDRLRVTAQLIRTSDQTHFWARDFDRPSGDLLDLQSEIAGAIASQLVPQIAAAHTTTPALVPKPAAYQAYLQARFHHAQATVNGIERALPLYVAAIEQDPRFALAHAERARALIFATRTRPAEALRLARESAERAVTLAPDLPHAHLAFAMTKLYQERDWSGAEQAFRRALDLDPDNAEIHFYFGQLLAALGRFDEALRELKTARQLEPFSVLFSHYVGRVLYIARRYDEAEIELTKTIDLDPNYQWTRFFLALTYQQTKRFDEAVAQRQRYWSLVQVSPEQVAQLGEVYRTEGYPAVIRMWAQWIEGFARERGFVTSCELVFLHAQLGDTKQALAWLERAMADQTRDLIFLKVEPGVDTLRSEPAFVSVLQRLNLS